MGYKVFELRHKPIKGIAFYLNHMGYKVKEK